MTTEIKTSQPSSKKAVAAGGLTGAALVALGLAVAGLKPDEGDHPVTYLDIAAIPTYCYGHADRSSKVGTNHTPAQCDAILRSDVSEKLEAVEKCTPVLENRPHQLAAATQLTFNIGEGNYCRSSTARDFNAGKLKSGCAHFMAWDGILSPKPIKGAVSYHKQGQKYFNVIRGLRDRRQREMAQCMEGL